MCRECESGQTPKEFAETITAEILDQGHRVIQIPGTREDPLMHYAWSYTVGRFILHGLPEILVTGCIDHMVQYHMIHHAIAFAESGEHRLENGYIFPPDTLLTGYPVNVIDADNTRLGFGRRVMGDDFPVVQLVWPDECGNFPGDDGYHYPPEGQPVFPKVGA